MNAERVEHEQTGASRQAIAQTASALSVAGISETRSQILKIGQTASDQLLPAQQGQLGILQTVSAKSSMPFRLGWAQKRATT